MTGLLRKAMLLACFGVLAASSAMAAIPNKAQSDVGDGTSLQCGLMLVARVNSLGGAADPRGALDITVRDAAGNPIPGSSVVIDLDACVGPSGEDIQICAVQPYPGVTATCTAPVGEISAVTNGSGTVRVIVVGSSFGGPAEATAYQSPQFTGVGCAKVFADGIDITPDAGLNVSTPDLDTDSGYLNDASVWKADYNQSIQFIPPDNYKRSDFDCDGQLLNDLSVWFSIYNAHINDTSTCANPGQCP